MVLLLLLTSVVRAGVDLQYIETIDKVSHGAGALERLSGTVGSALKRPLSVAVRDGHLLVADEGHNLIYSYDHSRKGLMAVAAYNRRIRGRVSGIYLSPEMQLYTVDRYSREVMVADAQQNFIVRLADRKNLNQPVAVCVESGAGHVFVADGLYGHIIEFDGTGRAYALHGARGSGFQAGNMIVDMACGENAMYVLSRFDPNITVISFQGALLARLPRSEVRNPTAIALDGEQRLYVADAFDERIRIYSQGRLIGSFGGIGSANHQFREIGGLWVDSERLYVADTGNRRIQVFSIVPEVSP